MFRSPKLRDPYVWLSVAAVAAVFVVVFMATRPGPEHVVAIRALEGGRAVLVTQRFAPPGTQSPDLEPPMTVVRLLDSSLDVIWTAELDGYTANSESENAMVEGDSAHVFLVLDRGIVAGNASSRYASLVALDSPTGERAWATELTPVGKYPFLPATHHLPILTGNRVIIAAFEDGQLTLHAFDQATGVPTWQLGPQVSGGEIPWNLVVVDDRLVAWGAGRTMRLNAATGAVDRIDEGSSACLVGGRPVALVDGHLTLLGDGRSDGPRSLGPKLEGILYRCGTYGDNIVAELSLTATAREWLSVAPDGTVLWRVERPHNQRWGGRRSATSPMENPLSGRLNRYVIDVDQSQPTLDGPPSYRAIVVDLQLGVVIHAFELGINPAVWRSPHVTLLSGAGASTEMTLYDETTDRLVANGVFSTSRRFADTREDVLWIVEDRWGAADIPFADLQLGALDLRTGTLLASEGGLTFKPTRPVRYSGLK